MSVWVSSKKASPSICWRRKTVGKKLHIHLDIAAGPDCCYYLSFKCSSMFFTSWQSFDKTGHLMGKRRENWLNAFVWLPNWSELLIPEWPVCVSWLRRVWLCKHVWPPQRSKRPLSWQSAPGPQGAAGSVCPSRGPPGVGETQRCRERIQTRGGPVGGRWFLERLGREVIFEFQYNNDLHVFIWFHSRVKHTFTVSDLLFNIVHFQVFRSRSSPERQ